MSFTRVSGLECGHIEIVRDVARGRTVEELQRQLLNIDAIRAHLFAPLGSGM